MTSIAHRWVTKTNELPLTTVISVIDIDILKLARLVLDHLLGALAVLPSQLQSV